MEIQKGLGGCFWLVMLIVAIVGLITFPFGILIWLVQGWIIYKILTS